MARQTKRADIPEPPRGGKIKARVIDEVNGLQLLDQIRAVRISSKQYKLLILEDYAPTLGQVEGEVTFLCADREVTFDNIFGFYKHQRNEFTLLIREDADGWYKKL